MVDISIDPILLRLGFVSISWHGLFLALAAVVGYRLLLYEGLRRGFGYQTLIELVLVLTIAGFLGARIVHIWEHWDFYTAVPSRLLAFHQGGLAILGAILGGILGTIIFTRFKALNFWKLMDCMVVAAPLAFIVGRVGCTILGDAWGLPTNGNWGLVYWHSDSGIPVEFLGVPTFPAPIMLQLWNLGVLVTLLILRRRPTFDGFLFAVYLIIYSSGRLIINTWQGGEIFFGGLKFAQLLALAIIVGGFGLMFYLSRRQRPILKPIT